MWMRLAAGSSYVWSSRIIVESVLSMGPREGGAGSLGGQRVHGDVLEGRAPGDAHCLLFVCARCGKAY